jgi:UDP-glucose 4-epimerase
MIQHSAPVKPSILITGGCGFIGANLINVLSNLDYNIKVLDDLSTGVIERISKYNIEFFEGSLLDEDVLFKSLIEVDLVIHLAAKKSVFESQENPTYYQQQNVQGTNRLIDVMSQLSISNLIFASTAAVYAPCNNKISEQAPLGPMSTYGETKVQNEKDIFAAQSTGVNSVIFRFANVLGSVNGLIDTKGSNLLMKSISRTNNGLPLEIYGADYETPDGTCVRDFIHVADLVEAIVIQIEIGLAKGSRVFNLGTGLGTSVQSFLKEYSQIVRDQEIVIRPRQDGDLPFSVLDSAMFQSLTRWRPHRDVVDMIKSSIVLS